MEENCLMSFCSVKTLVIGKNVLFVLVSDYIVSHERE